MKLSLPTDSAVRKGIPMYSGCLMYFPAALAGVARISKIGNDKHNPGKPLHHSRGISNDHADCVQRHLVDVGDMVAEIERLKDRGLVSPVTQEALLTEASFLAWRALALSQELHERYGSAPLAPAARLPESDSSRGNEVLSGCAVRAAIQQAGEGNRGKVGIEPPFP